MGKVKLGKKEWQQAEMFSDDFNDELLGYLGSFEEIVPDGVKVEEKPEKAAKKKKKDDDDKKPLKKIEQSENEHKDSEKKEKNDDWKKKRREKDRMNRKLKKIRLAKRKKMEQEKGEEAETEAEVAQPPAKKKKKEAAPKAKKEFDCTEWQPFLLPQPILTAIADMGFKKPTEIQSAVFPPAIRDRQDILGAAETGSGKTLAFAIPMVCRLLERIEENETDSINGPKALIVAPTRELVIQIMKHVTGLIKHTNIKAMSIVGGLAQVKQERIIAKSRPDIVVATPGRLWAMMSESESAEYLGNMTNLSCLVVDETDRMVEEGYFDDLTHILNKIHEEANREKLQTMVFSATLTFARIQADKSQGKIYSGEQKIQRLIKLTGLREKKHKVIDLTRQMGTAGGLVEARINCINLVEKDTFLAYLLTRYRGRTMVFVNSVDAARRLHNILKNIGMEPMILHAKMIQKQRLKNLEKFAESKQAVLLATDVAARGLDIKGIDHVIHYQVPKKTEIYIHRSGRTARAQNRGLTVLLVDPPSRQYYAKLCAGLNRMKDLEVFPIDFEPLLDALRTRVKLASEIDTMSYRCKKVKMTESWFEKAAKEAELDYDELRNREMEGQNLEVDNMVRRMRQLQMELREELGKKLPRPDGMDTLKTKYITPELVKKLESVGDDAIDVLNDKLREAQEWKKKSRKAQQEVQKNSMKGKIKNKLKSKKRIEEKKLKKKKENKEHSVGNASD